MDLHCSVLGKNANTSWKQSSFVAFPHWESRKPRTWGVLVLQVAKKCLLKRRTVETRALIAAWGNRRIHDKIGKSHRNADLYADIAKAVKKQGLSWTWLEAEWVLKKVHETSKSCDYQTRIFVSFSQLSGHKSTAMMKNFLEFLELSFWSLKPTVKAVKMLVK